MTTNSNEEYIPVGNLSSLSSPYSLVSCRNNKTEFVCIAESEKNAVRLSFSNYIAFRITLSAFRDYDMRNRFCKHLIYEIKNSFYLEQVRSFHKNDEIKNYHHFLLNLDDNVVDIIVNGDIIMTVANGLNETEDDISDNKEDILYVEEIGPTTVHLGHCQLYDLFDYAKHQEVLNPVGNVFGDFVLTKSNYGSVDLLLIIEPVNGNGERYTIVIPEILCIKETIIHHHVKDNQEKPSSLSESVLYEVQNSNFIEWIAYAGYRQLYGEPKDLRHIKIKLYDMIYDIIIDSKGERPNIIKEN